jgi:hypothetical protein
MNIALRIIAGLLAASGFAVVEDFSASAVKAIGIVEILAAVGLILPAALGIAPVLVPLAAVGVVLLMVGAVIVHIRRHETQAAMVPLALLAVAVLVAWGRL